MPLHIVKLLAVFLFGFLFIRLLPELTDMLNFITKLVLNPVQFLTACIAFFIGILLQGQLIKTEFIIVRSVMKHPSSSGHVLIALNVVVIGVLIYFGFVQTLIFFVTAVIYGIILIDFRDVGGHDA